jgi:hypothetical protein
MPTLPVRRTEPELQCVDISTRRRVLPQAARVSKRNELGRATARSSDIVPKGPS